MIEASAPAKVILFGEHAVVYGVPAIAVPVSSLRAYAIAEPNSIGGLQITATDLEQTLPVDISARDVDNALITTAQLVLRTANLPAPPLHIRLHSSIPMASGLGSGAAVSTALARVLSQAIGYTLSHETLNHIVYEVEKIHHGTPSGIDNTVIVYEQPVYFVRGTPIQTLDINRPFTLIVADTGKGALTRIAVGDVRKLFDSDRVSTEKLLNQVADIVVQARTCIETGNLETLGRLMTQNHALLQQLTVSSKELDQLVDAALGAGAIGAKLSGGGRGGNMIALIRDSNHEAVNNALIKAGAVRTFITQVR